mmetsp:Transcript_36116/g.104004  ORF Transcript_36116/g.104004 Transcript_36116/m.104004 type:complete len:492 (+) Transcript_36116:736-2211(+)
MMRRSCRSVMPRNSGLGIWQPPAPSLKSSMATQASVMSFTVLSTSVRAVRRAPQLLSASLLSSAAKKNSSAVFKGAGTSWMMGTSMGRTCPSCAGSGSALGAWPDASSGDRSAGGRAGAAGSATSGGGAASSFGDSADSAAAAASPPASSAGGITAGAPSSCEAESKVSGVMDKKTGAPKNKAKSTIFTVLSSAPRLPRVAARMRRSTLCSVKTSGSNTCSDFFSTSLLMRPFPSTSRTRKMSKYASRFTVLGEGGVIDTGVDTCSAPASLVGLDASAAALTAAASFRLTSSSASCQAAFHSCRGGSREEPPPGAFCCLRALPLRAVPSSLGSRLLQLLGSTEKDIASEPTSDAVLARDSLERFRRLNFGNFGALDFTKPTISWMLTVAPCPFSRFAHWKKSSTVSSVKTALSQTFSDLASTTGSIKPVPLTSKTRWRSNAARRESILSLVDVVAMARGWRQHRTLRIELAMRGGLSSTSRPSRIAEPNGP